MLVYNLFCSAIKIYKENGKRYIKKKINWENLAV